MSQMENDARIPSKGDDCKSNVNLPPKKRYKLDVTDIKGSHQNIRILNFGLGPLVWKFLHCFLLHFDGFHKLEFGDKKIKEDKEDNMISSNIFPSVIRHTSSPNHSIAYIMRHNQWLSGIYKDKNNKKWLIFISSLSSVLNLLYLFVTHSCFCSQTRTKCFHGKRLYDCHCPKALLDSYLAYSMKTNLITLEAQIKVLITIDFFHKCKISLKTQLSTSSKFELW